MRSGAGSLRRPIACVCGLAAYVCFTVAASAGDALPDPRAAGNSGADAGKIPLVVEATTDLPEVAELIAEFMTRNPDISVRYSKVVSGDLFDRVVKSAEKQSPVDVVWSSAMDLQIKLANDGYAAEYRSAEVERLPAWAQWKDRVYGVTAEPVVMIFNKRLLRGAMVPQDHADLLRLLTEHPQVFQGRIATYDPELIQAVHEEGGEERAVGHAGASTIAAAGLTAIALYLFGVLLNHLIGLPAPVAMLFLAVLAKLTRAVSPELQQGGLVVYEFVRTNMTYPLLFAIGVALTPWDKLVAAFHPANIITIMSTVVTIMATGFVVGRLMKMYPIETAIVNACHSGQGGTGDVAILTAANRMQLIPFAQIATRIGGAVTVTLVLLSMGYLK